MKSILLTALTLITASTFAITELEVKDNTHDTIIIQYSCDGVYWNHYKTVKVNQGHLIFKFADKYDGCSFRIVYPNNK